MERAEGVRWEGRGWVVLASWPVGEPSLGTPECPAFRLFGPSAGRRQARVRIAPHAHPFLAPFIIVIFFIYSHNSRISATLSINTLSIIRTDPNTPFFPSTFYSMKHYYHVSVLLAQHSSLRRWLRSLSQTKRVFKIIHVFRK